MQNSMELNPQEMFEVLIKKKKIAIPVPEFTEEIPPEINLLFSNIAVIKSRAKKIYQNLGLESDWDDLILSKKLDKIQRLVILELAPKPEPKKFFVQILD